MQARCSLGYLASGHVGNGAEEAAHLLPQLAAQVDATV